MAQTLRNGSGNESRRVLPGKGVRRHRRDYLHSAAAGTVEKAGFSAPICASVSGPALVLLAVFREEAIRMDLNGIDRMLSQLRTAAALASRKPETKPAETERKADFSDVLKNSLDQVNRAQNDAVQLSRSFTVGDPDTNLQDVMIAMQKSNIAFQQAVQVRNRLVQAYHDIMNMTV
jgi:flagellar hook-basal body complex protein FliE